MRKELIKKSAEEIQKEIDRWGAVATWLEYVENEKGDLVSVEIPPEEMHANEQKRRMNRLAWFDTDGFISIKTSPDPKDNDTYDIEMKRCRTAKQVLDWIHQLLEKTWAEEDPKIFRDFVEVLFEEMPDKIWMGK